MHALSFLRPWLLVLLASSCLSTSGPPALDARASLSDRYLFRGAVMFDGPVLQGSASATFPLTSGASASLTGWGNLDLTNDAGHALLAGGQGGRLSQVDLVPEYAWSWGEWNVALGLINYNFPNGPESTSEVYASATRELWGMSSSLTAYYDVQEVDGTYWVGSVARGWALGEHLTAELAGSLSWADADQAQAYYGAADGGLGDLTSVLTVELALEEGRRVWLSIVNATVIDEDIADALEAGGFDRANLSFALGMGWSR